MLPCTLTRSNQHQFLLHLSPSPSPLHLHPSISFTLSSSPIYRLLSLLTSSPTATINTSLSPSSRNSSLKPSQHLSQPLSSATSILPHLSNTHSRLTHTSRLILFTIPPSRTICYSPLNIHSFSPKSLTCLPASNNFNSSIQDFIFSTLGLPFYLYIHIFWVAVK